jgi:hypothetical protein
MIEICKHENIIQWGQKYDTITYNSFSEKLLTIAQEHFPMVYAAYRDLK